MKAGGFHFARGATAIGLLVMLLAGFAAAQGVSSAPPAGQPPAASPVVSSGASSVAPPTASTPPATPAVERPAAGEGVNVDRPLQRDREKTLDRAKESASGGGGEFFRIVLALGFVLLLIFALKWFGGKLVPGIATNSPAGVVRVLNRL